MSTEQYGIDSTEKFGKTKGDETLCKGVGTTSEEETLCRTREEETLGRGIIGHKVRVGGVPKGIITGSTEKV